MPIRSRSSEVPQRPFIRGSNPLRTSSSDSDPLHNRPVIERSPRLGDRRSPTGTQPDSKKLGSRIADLESQLGQAQKELKVLKVQLVSAEVAKKCSLKKSKKTAAVVRRPDGIKDSPPAEAEDSKEADSCISGDISSDNTQQETEAYEGMVEQKPEALKDDPEEGSIIDQGTKPLDASTDEMQTKLESEKPSEESVPKNDDIEILKSKLEEKEKELELCATENENLKNQLSEASFEIASAKAKEDETFSRLTQLGEELEASKSVAAELNGKLEAAKGEKEALEAEIKKMRVQTEQWRKAADAAAAVLAAGVEMNGRISERCGSMDKHLSSSVFHTPADGYTSFVGSGSPGMAADDLDESFRSGSKHKGSSGIRVFGDLWRKKGHK